MLPQVAVREAVHSWSCKGAVGAHDTGVRCARQRAGPEQWFHINVVLERCALLLPLPEAASAAPVLAPARTPARSGVAVPGGIAAGRAKPGTAAAKRGGVRGLSAAWQALRMGYSWGGEGETVARLGTRQLSAMGCLPGVPQLQVRAICHLLCPISIASAWIGSLLLQEEKDQLLTSPKSMCWSVIRFRGTGPALSATAKLRHIQVFAQDLLVPMDATAELHWRRPRATGSAASLTAALRASALHLQPSFGLVPLVHDALAALREAVEVRLLVRFGTCRKHVGVPQEHRIGHLLPFTHEAMEEFWQAMRCTILFASRYL